MAHESRFIFATSGGIPVSLEGGFWIDHYTHFQVQAVSPPPPTNGWGRMQMPQLPCQEGQQGQSPGTAMQSTKGVTFFPHPLVSAIFFTFVTSALFFLAL